MANEYSYKHMKPKENDKSNDKDLSETAISEVSNDTSSISEQTVCNRYALPSQCSLISDPHEEIAARNLTNVR